MTYGQLRLILTKSAPGVDPDLLDGWIDGRYMEILDRLQWDRLHVESVLQTVAPYETGTVLATEGSTSLTLSADAGSWMSAMTGRGIRIGERNEYYEFTHVGAKSGSLDRGFEGASTVGAGYMIFQSVYPLAADCRFVEDLRSLDPPGALTRFTRSQLDASFPNRPRTGTPAIWAPYMDDQSDPPRMQLELYPIPDTTKGLPITYVADKAALSAGTTSATLLPWLRPAALIEGVRADILAHQGESTSAGFAEKRFDKLVGGMALAEARRQGASRWRIHPRFSRHWIRAALRGAGRNRSL